MTYDGTGSWSFRDRLFWNKRDLAKIGREDVIYLSWDNRQHKRVYKIVHQPEVRNSELYKTFWTLNILDNDFGFALPLSVISLKNFAQPY